MGMDRRQTHRGGVAPVACVTGTRFDEGMRPLFIVGAVPEVRFDRIANFFLRAARRPRMLDTTISNISDQPSYRNQAERERSDYSHLTTTCRSSPCKPSTDPLSLP